MSSPTNITFQSPVRNVDIPPPPVASPTLAKAVRHGGELVGEFDVLRPLGGLSEVSRRSVEVKAKARQEQRRRALAEAEADKPRLAELAAEREIKKREIVRRVIADRQHAADEQEALRKRALEMNGGRSPSVSPRAGDAPAVANLESLQRGQPAQTKIVQAAITLQSFCRAVIASRRHKKKTAAALAGLHVISVLGCPGVGKGTLAERIVAEATANGKWKIVHISTGDLLRCARKRWKKRGDELEFTRSTAVGTALAGGELVDSSLVLELLTKALIRAGYHHPGGTVLLDNFPISAAQLDLYDLGHHGQTLPPIKRVVVLECAEETAVERMKAAAAQGGGEREEESIRATISRWKSQHSSVVSQFRDSGTVQIGTFNNEGAIEETLESAQAFIRDHFRIVAQHADKHKNSADGVSFAVDT